MKYSYVIVFVILIFYQFLSILATNEHEKSNDDHLSDRKTTLSRSKRQAFRTGKFFFEKT